MWRILAVCLAICLPLVSSTALRLDNFDAHKYFSHPKDVRNFTGGTSPRIIGGVEVKAHSYPSQAALMIYVGNDVYFCGGSLISKRWVLTAAHCLSMGPRFVLVVLGDHNLDEVDPPVVILNSTTFVYHNSYNGDTFTNDVGLIKLPQAVTFTDRIKPATLADGSDRYAGKKGTVVGWGQTESQSLSLVLRSVNVSVMTNAACAAVSDVYKAVIQDMHICTSGEGIVGSCSGDSGGPLFVDGVQVGIVSFGTTNCLLSMPSVFTRVNDFHDWIVKNSPDGAPGFDSLRLGAIVLVSLCFAHIFK